MKKRGRVSFLLVRPSEEEQTTCWHLRGDQRREASGRIHVLYPCKLHHLYTAPLSFTLPPSRSFLSSLYSVPSSLFPLRDDNCGKLESRRTPSGRLVFLSVCLLRRRDIPARRTRGRPALEELPVYKQAEEEEELGAFISVHKNKPSSQKKPQTTAAAPQQTNQPIRTEETH